MNITVAIPTIPPRVRMLTRAVLSVKRQTLPAELSVAADTRREGAAATRQRALSNVTTDWVAFLDDDDVMLPGHLRTLSEVAEATNADYVYSYYTVVDQHGVPWPGNDPLGHFGKEFDPANPIQTTIVTLVRTELAKSVGFSDPPPGQLIDGQTYGEDFQFTLGCVAAGAKIVHVPERSWLWYHHGGNTSGQPVW